jgi:hypothetical protein
MSNVAKWHSWVLNLAAGANPPDEWVAILGSLNRLGLEGTHIDKIELAAFSIRGKRTARWNLDSSDAEYATLRNSIGAAKKLTWLLLKSDGAQGVDQELYRSLKCAQSSSCVLLEGHEGECKGREETTTTTCPICLKAVELEDFNKDGRTDLYSIQMGHLIPLSKASEGHNARNVVWAHRICNYIQDEQTVEEAIETLRRIVEKHQSQDQVKNRTT